MFVTWTPSVSRFCATSLRLPFLALAMILTALSRAFKVTPTLALILMQRLPQLQQFVSAARNKYLNMVAAKEYDKLDSRKQKLMTITTTIEFLEVEAQLDE